jgi:hypothetical protein
MVPLFFCCRDFIRGLGFGGWFSRFGVGVLRRKERNHVSTDLRKKRHGKRSAILERGGRKKNAAKKRRRAALTLKR